MKLKNFQTYLEERLNKNEIAEIEEQALREVRILQQYSINPLTLSLSNGLSGK